MKLRFLLFIILALIGCAEDDPQPPPPDPPSNPVTTEASKITHISFDANWQSATGTSEYFLDVATVADFSDIVAGYDSVSVGKVTTYTVDSNLEPASQYFYRVRGSNEGGSSGNSNVIEVSTEDYWEWEIYFGDEHTSSRYYRTTILEHPIIQNGEYITINYIIPGANDHYMEYWVWQFDGQKPVLLSEYYEFELEGQTLLVDRNPNTNFDENNEKFFDQIRQGRNVPIVAQMEKIGPHPEVVLEITVLWSGFPEILEK